MRRDRAPICLPALILVQVFHLSDVRIARAEICPIATGINTITITTIPDFMTVVRVFLIMSAHDPQISPHIVTVNQIPTPCRCEIIGPSAIPAASMPVTAQYAVLPINTVITHQLMFGVIRVTNGDIDQNGLMTVPPFYAFEQCEICVTDTANTDINTGEVVACCRSIRIEGG